MLSTIVLKHNIVVIINVIFIAFSDCDYELRKFKISHKRTFSIFTALKYRFFKERKIMLQAYSTFLIKLTFL